MHERKNARTHERTNARTHERTNARTQERESAHSARYAHLKLVHFVFFDIESPISRIAVSITNRHSCVSKLRMFQPSTAPPRIAMSPTNANDRVRLSRRRPRQMADLRETHSRV